MKHLKLFLFLIISLFVNESLVYAQSNSNNVETYKPDNQNRKVKELNIELPLQKARGRGRTTVEIVDQMAIFEGDIVLGHEGNFSDEVSNGMAIAKNSYRWEDGIIPYKIASNHPRRGDILKAIDHIKKKTNICMVERTGERDYVKFIYGSGCWSYVGRQMFEQSINVGTCSVGSIIHEICHAAGMYHEQSRGDRDNHIEIKWANIKSGKSKNFEKRDHKGIDIGAYDFGSIMHYPSKAFSKNGQPTIVSKGGAKAFGQRNGLSPMDITTLNSLYPDASGCGNGQIPTPSGNGTSTSNPSPPTTGTTTTTNSRPPVITPTNPNPNPPTTGTTTTTNSRPPVITPTNPNPNPPTTGTTTTTNPKPPTSTGSTTTTNSRPPRGTGGTTTTTKPPTTTGAGGTTTTTKPPMTTGTGGTTTTTKPPTTTGTGGTTITTNPKPPTITRPVRTRGRGRGQNPRGQVNQSNRTSTQQPANKKQVSFYSKPNYKGDVIHLNAGSHTVSVLRRKFANGEIQSASFGEGVTLTLYPNTGQKRVFTKSIPNLTRITQYKELLIKVIQ